MVGAMSKLKRKQKAERFDPAAFQAEKLDWVRKVIGDARKCATYYGMDQRELDVLGMYLATETVSELAVPTFDAAREAMAAARSGTPLTIEQPVDPAIMAELRAELGKADEP